MEYRDVQRKHQETTVDLHRSALVRYFLLEKLPFISLKNILPAPSLFNCNVKHQTFESPPPAFVFAAVALALLSKPSLRIALPVAAPVEDAPPCVLPVLQVLLK